MPDHRFDAFGLGRSALVQEEVPCLTFEGPDAGSFLQGLISQDVLGLEVGSVASTCVLDSKGRILSFGDIAAESETAFTFVFPAGDPDVIYAHFEKYRIMERLEIGRKRVATARIITTGLQTPPQLRLFEGKDRADHPFSLAIARDRQSIDAFLTAQELTEVEDEVWDLYRVRHLVPQFGRDFFVADHPLVFGLTHAISRSKGCYIGQETVAMMRDRGKPPRLLARLRCASPTSSKTAELFSEGNPVGHLTTVVEDPDQAVGISLGVVKHALALQGTVLSTQSHTWTIESVIPQGARS